MATKIETKLNKIERELKTVKAHLEALLELSEGNLTRALSNDSKKKGKRSSKPRTKKSQELYSCSCSRERCKTKQWRYGGVKDDGSKWGLTAHKDTVLAEWKAGKHPKKPEFKKLKQAVCQSS